MRQYESGSRAEYSRRCPRADVEGSKHQDRRVGALRRASRLYVAVANAAARQLLVGARPACDEAAAAIWEHEGLLLTDRSSGALPQIATRNGERPRGRAFVKLGGWDSNPQRLG